MKTGPGFLVTAAFIGPGTVTACTLAGTGYGLTLIWVLVVATLATMLLQEMSARLALVTGSDLSVSLQHLAPPWGRLIAWISGLAVMTGVLAFEAGNLSGAGLGLAAVTGQDPAIWTAIVATVAATVLLLGHYRLIEKLLMGCVAIMAIAFLATAVAVAPAWGDLAAGALLPSLPAGSAMVALALLGTTLVPYNLFLYAHAVRERFTARELPAARRDLVLAVGIGGLVSVTIVITASAIPGNGGIFSAADMAAQLEPLLGDWAHSIFGFGLAAAGLTSAITAPLAGAWILSGLTDTSTHLNDTPMRLTMLFCIGVGTALALTDIRPVVLILTAQAANGLILPVIVLSLLVALNNRKQLGCHVNRGPGNISGAALILLCLLLAARIFLD